MAALESISAEARKIPVLESAHFRKSQLRDEKASRKFYGYTSYNKLHNFVKKQRILGILEQITELYANRDGHSETRVASRVLY